MRKKGGTKLFMHRKKDLLSEKGIPKNAIHPPKQKNITRIKSGVE